MKNSIRQILFTAMIISVSSCRIMYVPNSQNVPMMEEKGDIKANIGAKDLQVAYAITDHVGVMANGYYNKNNWSVTSGDMENKYISTRSLVEGGIGYYTAFDDIGRFEIYGGAGYGGVRHDYDLVDNGITTESNSYKASLTRFFMQPAIGIQKENVGFAFSSRFAGVTFSTADSSGYSPTELLDEGLIELDNNLFLFLEPAVTFRVGFKYVQAEFQPYYNLQLAGPSSLKAKKMGLNFTIYLSIDDFFK
jgi:hypothetical protein